MSCRSSRWWGRASLGHVWLSRRRWRHRRVAAQGREKSALCRTSFPLKLLVLTRGGVRLHLVWSSIRPSIQAMGFGRGGADSRVDPFIHVFSMHLSTSSRCSYAPQCPHFDVGFNNKFSTHSTFFLLHSTSHLLYKRQMFIRDFDLGCLTTSHDPNKFENPGARVSL